MDTKNITGKNHLYIDDAKPVDSALSYVVDGLCSQDGTPTPDSPVEVKTIPTIINLFDKNNANVLNAYINNTKVNGPNTSTRTLYIPITGGKTYTVSKIVSSRFQVGTTANVPANNEPIIDYIYNNNSNSLTINTSATANYLCVFFYHSSYDTTLTPEEIINTIMIEESSVAHEYVPYGYYSKVKVTGKNLFNKDNANILNVAFYSTAPTIVSSGNSRTIYISCNPNTTYTIQRIAGLRFAFGYTKEIPAIGVETYATVGGNSTETSYTITTGNDAKYLVAFVYNSNTDTITFQDILDSTQIEKSSAPTTYEPYKENQVLIDMSKENLYDKTTYPMEQGSFNYNNNSQSGDSNRIRSPFFPIQPSTTYTISCKEYLGELGVIYEQQDGTTLIAGFGITVNGSFYTFTTPNNAYYMRFRLGNGTYGKTYTTDYNIRVLEGNSPTPYYELCKIGDYKDTLSIDSSGNCVINKNVGKVVLNGSENWSRGSNGDDTYRFYIPKPINSAGSTTNLYSNYFIPNASYSSTDNSLYIGSSNIVLSRILTNGSYINELNDFKTWLSTHNTEIYYPIPLLTPEIITLKNQPLPLFSGVNHITFVDDLETDTTLIYENDINPSDKQALIDGSATIQTEIVVHNDNLYDSSYRNANDKVYGSNCVATEENGEFTLKAAGSDMRIWSVQSTGAEYDELSMGKLYEFEKDTYTMIVTNPLFTKNFVTYYDENKVSLSYVAKNGSTFTINKSDKAGAKYFAIRIGYSPATIGDIYKFKVILEEGTIPVLTETNSVIDWNHEDFRQVKDEGFIGQFVARQVTGNLHNLDDDFSITDKELELKLGVRTNNNTNWYSLGNFLTTKVTDDEVSDKTNFEALDYTKKFNKAFIDRLNYPVTALTLARDVCDQCGVELATLSFKNSDYVIEGNVFTNNESCRDVMKAIGKLAFSWIRADWDNKVYIDFNPTPFTTNQTPDDYDTIGNNKYYNLKTQKEVFGPVDKVVIGYSAIEGERTYIGEENGTCVLNIFDNPLVFNQEQRAAIIESASDLLGFTYTPLNTLTVGHPWLKGNEIVRVSDMENVSHMTMPLDRTIQYFGHIKTLINSTTETKTNDNLSYKPEMVKNYERSEIYNDQMNKQIGIIINEQTDTSNRLNETISTLDGTIQRVSNTETSINDIITTTQHSSGKNHLYLEEASQSNVLEYNVDGATEQDGTPTPDSPIEVKNIPSIINLFDNNIIKKNQSSYDTITDETISTGKKLTYTGTTATTTKFLVYTVMDLTNYVGKAIRFKTNFTPSANNKGRFIIGLCNADGSNRTSKSTQNTSGATASFTVPTLSGQQTYLFVSLYVNTENGTVNANDYIEFTNMMLTIDDENMEYVPYGYYSKIKVTGKQLFKPDDYTTLTLGNNGSATNVKTTDKITITTGSGSTNSGIYFTLRNYIDNYNANTDYYVSFNVLASQSLTLNIGSTTKDTRDVGTTKTRISILTKLSNSFVIYSTNNRAGDTIEITDIMVATNDDLTYEPYKENQALIDMSKENLFDIHTPITYTSNSNGDIVDDSLIITTINGSGGNAYAIIPILNSNNLLSKTITLSANMVTNGAATRIDVWQLGSNGRIVSTSLGSLTNDGGKKYITLPSSYTTNATQFGLVFFARVGSTGATGSTSTYSNVKICEGSGLYHELCKIGDYKDTLSIDSSGNIVINKNVGKVVLNGSENWSKVNLAFQVGASTTPNKGDVSLNAYSNYYIHKYYPSGITSNIKNGEFGWNSSKLLTIRNDSCSTVTDFKTWLGTYNTSVYYILNTPETINLSNTKIPLYEGINHVTFVDDLETDTSITYYRNTPLSGTYATVTQLNDVSTEKTQEIIQVRNEVQTEISSTQASINVINETIENGVSKVNGTGYTFDSEGLKIEKTNQDVKSLLDNDGLAVSYKGTDLLTVRSNGIEAENMTVRKFYVQRPIRMEKTKSISDGSSIGLGFFYVGEEE